MWKCLFLRRGENRSTRRKTWEQGRERSHHCATLAPLPSLPSLLFPEVSYSKALEDAGLKTLFHRREELCSTLFKKIVESDGQQKLAGLLPMRNYNERYNFRNRRMFSIPRVKTKRFRNSFIMHYADKQQL